MAGRRQRPEDGAARRQRAGLFGLLAVLALTVALPSIIPARGARAGGANASAVSSTAASTPTWQLKSYRRIGFDRSFKADLIDELPAPPQLVVFGGSRASRFEPDVFVERTGLTAFNCAVQNCRPEDAYAISSYLFARAPDVRLHCFFAVQTASFVDGTMHQGLLYDDRLTPAFPADLVAQQKVALGKARAKEVLGANRYAARGLLLRNSYDIRRAAPGYSFRRNLEGYIRRLLPKYRWRGPAKEARARAYFEKTMLLYNAHGVVPAVVLMPYHPRALQAFRAVGWQKKFDRLTAYLRDARTRCAFRVVNLVRLASFEGRARWFYDGAHVTRENARLIMRRVVRAAPECCR